MKALELMLCRIQRSPTIEPLPPLLDFVEHEGSDVDVMEDTEESNY